MLKLREGWMLHTFARMNCANARLVEPFERLSAKAWDTDDRQAPFSVWHEIQVSMMHPRPGALQRRCRRSRILI